MRRAHTGDVGHDVGGEVDLHLGQPHDLALHGREAVHPACLALAQLGGHREADIQCVGCQPRGGNELTGQRLVDLPGLAGREADPRRRRLA